MWYLWYSLTVSASIKADTDTETTMPVRTQIMISIHRDRYVPRLVREFISMSKEKFGSAQDELSSDVEFLALLRK